MTSSSYATLFSDVAQIHVPSQLKRMPQWLSYPAIRGRQSGSVKRIQRKSQYRSSDLPHRVGVADER